WWRVEIDQSFGKMLSSFDPTLSDFLFFLLVPSPMRNALSCKMNDHIKIFQCFFVCYRFFRIPEDSIFVRRAYQSVDLMTIRHQVESQRGSNKSRGATDQNFHQRNICFLASVFMDG